ncbi:MAG: HAMP domain-containing histidine kinase [Chloroflexi bacterium]|nr:HAMP domain-containing histidine kinase [Chloroflexota bacterium]
MSKKHKHWQHKRWSRQDWHGRDWPENWSGKPAGIFVWFMFMFGTMMVLLLGGIGGLIFLAVRALERTEGTAVLFWLAGCGLVLALPILAMGIARRAFLGIASPLSDVMNAADKVAAGDLTTRVPERRRRNQFARLARSFNNMTAELQRADEQRRNLTADVAHELRTPLHIIQGNLEGVLDGVYEPTPEHIEATLEETHLLARLVNDLHTLAQAEAGQLTLRREPVDLTELLADAQTSFSGMAEAKEINLTVDFEGKPADLTIEGDAGRLDQVVSNLLSNALRHTAAHGRIHLHAQRHNNKVTLQVSDNGEGIPAEDLPYIFDRFWRGDRARTHSEGIGGGLGLAIVKQLVEAHDGRITVQSELDQETTFTLSFPASSY